MANLEDVLRTLTKGIKLRPGANRAVVLQTLDQLGVAPPADYIAFLEMFNGGSGFMPNGSYLSLDPIEDLIKLNEPYGFGDEGPGLISFGSNGATEYFAFDVRQRPITIVQANAVSMDQGELIHRGNTFVEFLQSFASNGCEKM